MAKYKGHFNFSPSSDSFDCTVRKGLPWWFWLLVAIPLLLIASLFVRCNREITVQVLDQYNNPVENAVVKIDYTARYFPGLSEEIARSGETNDKGEYRFSGLPCSVCSYIFHRGSEATVSASLDESIVASKSVKFHSTDRVVLKLEIPEEKCSTRVRVVDNFTGAPIPQAEVLVTIGGSGRGTLVTDPQGMATISGFSNRQRVSAAARHPGYIPNDTSLYNQPGLNIRDKVIDIPLDPLVECNQKVEHQTGDPHVEIKNIDMGVDSGTVAFRYYTDSWPDQLIVTDANGKVLFDSGMVATYSLWRDASITFSTRTLNVEINSDGAASGSLWQFILDCP